jgi:5-formyltetrahydrofolate cyclo-ligase
VTSGPPDHADPTPGAAKDALRRLLRARRDAVPPAQRAIWSQDLAAPALAALGERAHGAIVGAYWPVRSEADPRPLAFALAALGARLALPVVMGATMEFRGWLPGEALEPAGFGAFGPGAASALVAPTLLLVPLVGFDRRGARLGQGKGFYDRWLAAADRAGTPPFALGIAFACQEVEHVPTEAHDRTLDAIATERGVTPVARPRG